MTTARIQIHIEPDHLALTLGERASIEVEVFNGSPIVDEFRVDLIGPWIDPIRPEWVTAQPRSLALFPNTSGVVVLTLDVPAASQLLAGRHILGIRTRSITDATHAFVEELPVTVTSQPVVALHLDPQAVNGRSTGLATVVARNAGNVPVNLWFSTMDPSNAIAFELADTELLLQPDEEARIPLTLRARRPLLGSGIVRPYTVQADVEDRAGDVGAEATPYVEGIRADGTFAQRARINGRVLTAIGFLLPVLAILAAAFILRPQAEPLVLTGPLTFGVPGVVQRVEVRPGQFVLAHHRIATVGSTDAQVAFNQLELELRRAIVDLEGLKTAQLVEDAGGVLGEQGATATPDFLQALMEQLQAASANAASVASTALTGLSAAMGRYCDSVQTRPPECQSQPIPLPAAFVTQLTGESATNPLATAVVDANANYRSAAATRQAVERLAQSAEQALAAAGGPPKPPAAPAPAATATPDPNIKVTAALAAQSAQKQTDYELKLLEQQATIAKAQLACRTALQDVGRTVLRAPVDVIVNEVLVNAGADVKADTPVVVVERTDGRVFRAPPGNRAPDAEDLPKGAACPGTITELRTSDAAALP